MSLGTSGGRGMVLDFDIENRPLSYWVPDRPTAEPTAIASMWIVGGEIVHDSIEVLLLGEVELPEMLERFRARYDEADVVTGHYITRHDLPILNGAMYDASLPLLGSKMASDTKTQMFKKADIPANQEYLLELLEPVCPIGMPIGKYHMTQRKWRAANRLTPEGLAETRRRVASDVHDHAHMRAEMLSRGLLGSPRMWNSGGGEVVEGRRQS